MIRNLIVTIATVCTVFITNAQGIKTPAASSTQTIRQDFGVSAVELSYSRPGMKGRKIFGDLVPYGQVWRTGANGATVLTFNDDVIVAGTKIPAGKYGLLSIPDKGAWTWILTKQLDVTNPVAYKQDQDVVRIKATPVITATPVESFTIQFANIKPNSMDLQLMWENTAVNLPITNDVESKVLAQINDAMNKDNRPYYQSAVYYLENGKDLNQALTWFNKAIEQNPDAYYMYYQKANALVKLGRKEEARQTSQKSMELAKQQNNNDYVRLNEKLLANLK